MSRGGQQKVCPRQTFCLFGGVSPKKFLITKNYVSQPSFCGAACPSPPIFMALPAPHPILLWGDPPPNPRPYFFLREKKYGKETRRGLPPYWYLLILLCLSINSGCPCSPTRGCLQLTGSNRQGHKLRLAKEGIPPFPFGGTGVAQGSVHCNMVMQPMRSKRYAWTSTFLIKTLPKHHQPRKLTCGALANARFTNRARGPGVEPRHFSFPYFF